MRALSELVRSDGLLSVITVEYDIRDDVPDGTDVFTLEPSSAELLEKLLEQRFPEILTIDIRTVAEFSGGNARIAIALAETISRNETITGLSSVELFQRLFEQRHGSDPNLLAIAQSCALLYSFNGEILDGNEAELPVLGELTGKSASEIFSGVAELERRDLVQRRGPWRAILPHAIANRLAATALQNVPTSAIDRKFVRGSSERLLRSFSRRLGYLDASPEAVQIVEEWLAEGGLIGNPARLNELGFQVFKNVAPVAPAAALAALERSVQPNADLTGFQTRQYIHIIRLLAYDAALFDRAAALLIRFAEQERGKDSMTETTEAFASLFFIYLSGTHATLEQRLAIASRLLRSDETAKKDLGLKALESLLTADQFFSVHNSPFGARSRDHGYWPKSREEIEAWYNAALVLAESLISSEGGSHADILTILARRFRGLWCAAEMHDDLERIARQVAEKRFWREGWIAVRQVRIYGSDDTSPESLSRLQRLEDELRPRDLANRVRAFVLTDGGSRPASEDVEDNDDFEANWAAAQARIVELGRLVAADIDSFNALVPELVSTRGDLFLFGRGLAAGTDTPSVLWQSLVQQFGKAPDEQRNAVVLCGFLNGWNATNPSDVSDVLDDALTDPILGSGFPFLQGAVPLDSAGVSRLRQAILLRRAPAGTFRHLVYGRASDPIPSGEFKNLVLGVGQLPDGHAVAVGLVYMRLRTDRTDKRPSDAETLEAGRVLLGQWMPVRSNDRDDHQLGTLAKICLGNDEGKVVAYSLCQRMKESFADHGINVSECDDLLSGIASVQPEAFLHIFMDNSTADQKVGMRFISTLDRYRQKNPFGSIPDDAILAWCSRGSAGRYKAAAAVVPFWRRADDKSPLEWTSIASRLVEEAPNPLEVTEEFVSRFYPMSWSGSRAAILEARVKLIEDLESRESSSLADFLPEAKAALRADAERERQRETAREKDDSERFE